MDGRELEENGSVRGTWKGGDLEGRGPGGEGSWKRGELEGRINGREWTRALKKAGGEVSWKGGEGSYRDSDREGG